MKNILADTIIINYNSTEYALRCIASVKQYLGVQAKIIVVDNNSYDRPDRIIEKYPDVKLIKNTRNIGFGRAINHALSSTNSEHIILLNPDTVILDSSFVKIFGYLDAHPNIAVAGPMIRDRDGSIQGSARRFPTIWTSIFGRKSPLTKLFPGNPISKREFLCFNGGEKNPKFVDWVSGACMIIRRDAIKQVGGFDERFFMYWEDADLCKRLKELGWEILYYPEVQIYHFTGKSSDTRPISSIYNFHKSCYYYFKIHTTLPKRIVSPFALFGLSLRCLFVMATNGFQRMLNGRGSAPKLVQTHDDQKKQANKKIKVLRIVSRLNIGGPSIHCAILAKGLNKQKFISKLLTGRLSPHEGDMSYLFSSNNNLILKVPELQREINFSKDLKAFFRVAMAVFKEKPDIVHTHMAKAGAVSRAAVFFYNLISHKKIRTVHTYHGHVLEGYFSPLKSNIFIRIEKTLAKVTDVIIAISQTQKWELIEKYKLASADKVHVINLGFNLNRLIKPKGKGILRSSLGIGDQTLLIGIVGRLVPIKNHLLFLNSAKLIKEKYPKKSIRYIIVGDGELREYLESYTEKVGMNEDVVFYGWEKDIQKIYADLDILLLTSNNEGTPVSIIESMAASVPVVTTGVGGIKDLLGRIETSCHEYQSCSICERGILCPKDDPEAVADGIAYSIDNDNAARVNRARDFVLEKYSDKQLIQRIEKLYDYLIMK